MKPFSRLTRLAAAGALAASTLAIFGASPAGAVSTGTVVNNGAGGVTVTYSADAGDIIGLHVYTALTPCDQSNFPPAPQYYLLAGDPQLPTPLLGASPATVDQTTQMHQYGAQGAATIPTGTYQFCLYITNGANFTYVSGVQTTIGTVTPTTVVTTTTSTTATPTPVTPAITG